MATATGVIYKDHYTTHIKTNKHVVIADEPAEHGGADSGFAPSELLAASLIACTCITLRMYADRKGYEIQETKVTVTIENLTDGSGTLISRTLQFAGSLTVAEQQRLLEIANKCPVHKMLTGTIHITTTIATT